MFRTLINTTLIIFIFNRTFSASEIRGAFLRFFVANMIDYEEYFAEVPVSNPNGSSFPGTKTPTTTTTKTTTTTNTNTKMKTKKTFNKDAFAAHLQVVNTT